MSSKNRDKSPIDSAISTDPDGQGNDGDVLDTRRLSRLDGRVALVTGGTRGIAARLPKDSGVPGPAW